MGERLSPQWRSRDMSRMRPPFIGEEEVDAKLHQNKRELDEALYFALCGMLDLMKFLIMKEDIILREGGLAELTRSRGKSRNFRWLSPGYLESFNVILKIFVRSQRYQWWPGSTMMKTIVLSRHRLLLRKHGFWEGCDVRKCKMTKTWSFLELEETCAFSK